MPADVQSTGSATQKLDGLEALRGVAATVVLIHHATGSTALPQNYNTELVWGFFAEGNLGVNIFFVLSGFVIAHSNRKSGRTFRDVLIYVLRRLSRIFPMYWLACLATLPIYWKFAPAALGEITMSRVVHDFLLLPYKDIPMLRVAWTLVFELMFYLLYIPLLVDKRAGSILWAVITGGILIVAATGAEFRNPWAIHLTSPIILQFVAGMIICHWTSNRPLSPRMARASFWTGTVLMFLTAAGECISGADWIESNVHYAGCAALMVLGIANAPPGARRERGRAMRALQVLGRYSFSIYLLHIAVQQILLKLALKVTGPAPGTLVVSAVTLLLIAASLAFGVMAGRYFEIPMLEWCKKRIARLKPVRTASVAVAPAAPA